MPDTPDKTKPPGHDNAHDRSVTFTLDGRTLTAPSSTSTAQEILRLGGLDPAGYDLKRIRPGHAPEPPYDDDRKVHINNGDEFLSVRQSAQVA